MLEKKQEHVTVYHGGQVPAAEAKQLAHNSFQFEDYAMLKEFGFASSGDGRSSPILQALGSPP